MKRSTKVGTKVKSFGILKEKYERPLTEMAEIIYDQCHPLKVSIETTSGSGVVLVNEPAKTTLKPTVLRKALP